MRFQALKSHVLKLMEEQLPDGLSYHGLHHTLSVMKAAERIVKHEGLTPQEEELLMAGVLLHDIGFVETYHNHEEKGVEIASSLLPSFGYNTEDIQIIHALILRTKIPQSAYTRMEQIICDADLDYLGTDDFFAIGNTLFEELKRHGVLKNEKEWNRLQVSFLSSHSYYTDYARKYRQQKKEENFLLVKNIVETYED